MRRETRAEWARRVEQWRRSGGTGAAFAAGLGVKESTLRHWKWQLDREAKGQSRRRDEVAGFVRVATVDVPTVEAGAERIEIELVEGLRIRVPAHFEAETLRRVLQVARER